MTNRTESLNIIEMAKQSNKGWLSSSKGIDGILLQHLYITIKYFASSAAM